jgi:hypothetical protein
MPLKFYSEEIRKIRKSIIKEEERDKIKSQPVHSKLARW